MTPPDGAVQGAIHIADCLAHAVRWEGVFGCNLLIGFVCFDPVEPGEGVGDIAQERAVDGFRGVARRCCTALAESEIRLWWWPRYVRA